MAGVNYDRLYDFILEHDLLSEHELNMVKVCINDIQELSSSDKPLIFKKIEKLIVDADNLSWCIYSINLQYGKLQKALKMVKDPDYVMLVKQGRPSSEAINAEIRFRRNEVYDNEELLLDIEYVIEYLKHLELSLDRYRYMLIDKVKFGDS